MIYALLNSITLPFQTGCENIAVFRKPKELIVIKRIFEDNRYKYTLQSDKSLLSWQGRVSMIVKGVFLCLPLIGHITSLTLRYFSSSIFPEMPLDCATKCSFKERIELAKLIYTTKPQELKGEIHTELVTNLIGNKGSDILIKDVLACLALDLLKTINQEINTSDFNGQIDPEFITKNFNFYHFSEDVQQKAIKYFISQWKKNLPSDDLNTLQVSVQTAINYAILQKGKKDPLFVQQLLIEDLADTLIDDEEGFQLVLAHINFSSIEFTRKIIQKKPDSLKQVKNHFAKKILEKDPTDSEFIIHLFNTLNLNENLQQEVIKELLSQMKTSTPSDKIQVAIARAIIDKSPRGFAFLLANIDLFKHTQSLADLLTRMDSGKAYIATNLAKFQISEEQKTSLFQKCNTPPILV